MKPLLSKMAGLSTIGRALRSRNYRLFFSGQSISLIGTWMTQTATIWLVYDLTNSALWLGAVGFASQIPSFLLAPFAGVLVDRWERHRTLIGTQILSMLQSSLLATLALTGAIDVWHLIALSIFQGLINAFDMPARQAFVVDMVENREDLSNAIALNSSMFSGARLVGPAIAGLAIAAVGAGFCFLIDAVSYIAVIAGLLAMKIERKKLVVSSTNDIWQRFAEGLRYAFGFAPIRALLLLMALVSLMGMPYIVLVPIFATQILHGGAQTLGFLMAASGFGALVGGIYLSSRRSIVGLGGLITIAPAAFGIGLIAFALSQYLWLSLIAMAIAGLSLILQVASSNTILQTIVDEDKRGRVMSFYSMSFTGTVTFGNLLAGAAANRIGASATLVIGGIACILGAVWFYKQKPIVKPMVRSIYARMGILNEVR
ncbi:MAG: MFS transporter [Hydrococcus sp. Prado102]|jgi:MFS family permease|nr:MFS transporter [Hydrococcus sp. Prado102]